ncbi:hypothetical protein Tco_0804972 [Tanacetum coccineum]
MHNQTHPFGVEKRTKRTLGAKPISKSTLVVVLTTKRTLWRSGDGDGGDGGDGVLVLVGRWWCWLAWCSVGDGGDGDDVEVEVRMWRLLAGYRG